MKMLRVVFIAAGIAASAVGYSQRDTLKLPTDTIKPGKPDTMMLYNHNHVGLSLYNDYSYNVALADTIKPDTAKTSYSDTYPAPATTGTENANGNMHTQTVNQPNFGRYYIPVLGSYTSSTQSEEQNKNVTIQGDEQNPGKIWIEGLTTEKIYALRKATAGTYKIPAQKVSEANIPEGTVLYDDNNKEVRICIGRKFVDNNPSEAFNVQTEDAVTKKNKHTVEKKASIISFTGTKTDAGTAKM